MFRITHGSRAERVGLSLISGDGGQCYEVYALDEPLAVRLHEIVGLVVLVGAARLHNLVVRLIIEGNGPFLVSLDRRLVAVYLHFQYIELQVYRLAIQVLLPEMLYKIDVLFQRLARARSLQYLGVKVFQGFDLFLVADADAMLDFIFNCRALGERAGRSRRRWGTQPGEIGVTDVHVSRR